MKTCLLTTFVSIAAFAAAQNSLPNGKDWTLFNPSHTGSTMGLSGTSPTITYHGGPVMGTTGSSPVNIYYIWYGNWASLDPTAQTVLHTLANNIGGSAYFNINTTYYNSLGNQVLNAVSFPKFVFDNYSQGTSLTDTGATGSVEAIVKGHIGVDLPLDPNGVYFVLTTPDVNETTGFCTQYCGWHSYYTDPSGVQVKYAFIGDPLRCPGACSYQAVGPNGSGGGDGMTSIVSHELEESTTDPLLNAWWFNASGNENADQCAWTFGPKPYPTAANGAWYNVTLGGMQFMIQQNWVNDNGGYCALSYPSGPDFSLTPSPWSRSVNSTGSTSYAINLGALAGFTGSVALSVTGSLPTGVTASITGSPVTVPGSATLNVTTSGAANGSYSITIQGVSGGLTQTATVNLSVLKTADFTISVSPSSGSVNQGSSTTYTVSIGSLGGFSSSVSFGTSGLPSGASASFSPLTVSGSGSTTMTVTTSATTPLGTYPFTVTGTAGSLSHNASTSLTVTAIGAFTPIRINTGGAAYTDTMGNLWNADADYNSGNVGTTTATIAGTPDQPLYQNWRISPDHTPLIYTFNSIPNGSYTVYLDFADSQDTAAGQRVFNVAINGTTVLSNFDIVQTAGPNTALVESFPATASTGQITVQFTNVSGRNAIINALAILSSGSSSPSLSSIVPNTGTQGATITGVALAGSNLSGATINAPTGITVSSVTTSASSMTATFTISATAPTGPQSVTVTNGGVTSNPVTFTVNAGPSLTSITPNSGTQGATITGVTLAGSNLSGATINAPTGITVSSVTTSASSITATFTISATAPTGPQSVTVTNGGVTSNPVTFTVNAGPALTSITPNSGTQGATITGVTLAGSNLSGATINAPTGITVSGVTTSASSITATFAISATAPTGPQSVTVTNGGVTSNPVTFTVNGGPALTSITPNNGTQGATITGVTLAGSNLSGATINAPTGITVSSVTTSASSITATFTLSATAPTGPQSVTVTNGGVTSNAVTFTINGAPSLTSITPNSGTQGATITGVTLAGSNLSGATINAPTGITVSSVTTSASSITATFTISATAPTGPQNVTVTNAGLTSNAVTFTINAASFTPIRINTGGGAYTDTAGHLWSADADYNAGNVLSTTNTIAGTPDQPLYQNWRISPDHTPLIYTFNSIPNGPRTVILEFADAQVTGVGQRIFNVAINGVTVLSNFDIFQTAGANTALVETFPVTVSSGQIVIQFSNVSGRNAIVNALAIQ